MKDIVSSRLDFALRSALGNDIARFLDDETLTDLTMGEDGRLWTDRIGHGHTDTGCTMSAADAKAALCLIADYCGDPLTRESPILSAQLPRTGERIAATIPPITEQPTFAIRIPPRVTFELKAFARCDGEDEPLFAPVLAAIEARRNILIAGATGSGKTSFLSTLLKTPSVQRDRCVVLEENARELVVRAPDQVRMLTSKYVEMRALVKISLRYHPKRIILGEILDGHAAIELIHALNTGHAGSASTIHANSARDAPGRLEDLCSEVCIQPPCRSIARAIGCIVFLEDRKISEVIYVDGWDGDYLLRDMAETAETTSLWPAALRSGPAGTEATNRGNGVRQCN